MNNTKILLPHLKLRFTIEHPNLEECYAYGYECALAEVNEEENPYRAGTREYEQWLDGWWAGFYGEEPLFELPLKAKQPVNKQAAANDHVYHAISSMLTSDFFTKMLKITGALAATVVVGYQVLDLVA